MFILGFVFHCHLAYFIDTTVKGQMLVIERKYYTIVYVCAVFQILCHRSFFDMAHPDGFTTFDRPQKYGIRSSVEDRSNVGSCDI